MSVDCCEGEKVSFRGQFLISIFLNFWKNHTNRQNSALWCWKKHKFSLQKIFRQIDHLVTSLVKTLLSRNSCQKVREKFRNFHIVAGRAQKSTFHYIIFTKNFNVELCKWNVLFISRRKSLIVRFLKLQFDVNFPSNCLFWSIHGNLTEISINLEIFREINMQVKVHLVCERKSASYSTLQIPKYMRFPQKKS